MAKVGAMKSTFFDSPMHWHETRWEDNRKISLSINHSLFSSAIYFLPLCKMTLGILIGGGWKF
jgi:hypothetical protein